MIEYIASHKLHIQEKEGSSGAIYGGGYDENGTPTNGPGFYLGTDGRLKAVDGEFSGTVNADSGIFNNITISGDSLFQGTINSGPLVLSNETPQAKNFTYDVGTGFDTIYNEASTYLGFGNDSGTEKAYSVIGTYGNTSIIRIGYYWEKHLNYLTFQHNKEILARYIMTMEH
jgi:hypothetical protein